MSTSAVCTLWEKPLAEFNIKSSPATHDRPTKLLLFMESLAIIQFELEPEAYHIIESRAWTSIDESLFVRTVPQAYLEAVAVTHRAHTASMEQPPLF